MTAARSIFVTNNGLADHIGVAQVLPYMQGLARMGHDITVISVEYQDNWHTNAPVPLSRETDPDCKGTLSFAPIFRKRGLAGKLQRFAIPYQIQRRLMKESKRLQPDLIHCRSYMPLAPSLAVSESREIGLMCDLRAFWIDQRIEGGIWSENSPLDRAKITHFRRLENRAYGHADRIVTLTHDAKKVVMDTPSYGGAPVDVVPCSVDQNAFKIDEIARERTRETLGIPNDSMVLCYLGSTSGVYRMDIVYRLFDRVRAQCTGVKMLMLGAHDPSRERAFAAELGVALEADELITRKVPHDAVPDMLNAADIGLSFQVSTPSSLGVSATKVGEYMACGLPVASNDGVGDIKTIIRDGINGAVLMDDTIDEIERVAQILIAIARENNRPKIKAMGRKFYSLDNALATYDSAYRAFAENRRGN